MPATIAPKPHVDYGRGSEQTERNRVLGEVNLNYTNVTDAGLKHLSQLQQFTAIAPLPFYRVSDAGLKLLATFPDLGWLVLDGTKTTAQGKAAFCKSAPRCDVDINIDKYPEDLARAFSTRFT